MANMSWYGGASVQNQSWPINEQNVTMQPFTVSNLRDNPSGFGSVLERYFLGSSGKGSSPYLVRRLNNGYRMRMLSQIDLAKSCPYSLIQG